MNDLPESLYQGTGRIRQGEPTPSPEEDDIACLPYQIAKNAVVKEFNTKREIFPSLIIANLFKYEKMPLFEVSDETERENVKVKF